MAGKGFKETKKFIEDMTTEEVTFKEDKKTAKKTEKKDEPTRQLNVKIRESNFRFIVAFSKISGISQAEVINRLIEREMDEHGDLVSMAEKLRESLKI